MPVANPSHEVSVEIDGHIATVEMHRPPHNFFDTALVRALGDAYHALDAEPDVRAIILAAEGRSFCAGAALGARPRARMKRPTSRLGVAPAASTCTSRARGSWRRRRPSLPRSRARRSGAASGSP